MNANEVSGRKLNNKYIKVDIKCTFVSVWNGILTYITFRKVLVHKL